MENAQTLVEIKYPSWLLSDEEIEATVNTNQSGIEVDETKFASLIKRRGIHGDIVQNATKAQLRYLMLLHGNQVPLVIKELQDWMNKKGSRPYITPAFNDCDCSLVQPEII